ncbi:hypothetical protein L226DRAFT_573548 [Lentinus tigrinus ALCF2SS1-7]|uniref:Uncharacterized protein n=1 Tax=Lentinus tigrinus ALCF2SS1-6 TaxID=1328759 RepID=A0A5C2S2S2_9APHY|nr:hypothetical protein L227DRAFT_577731 [Lentinus tigrinus ALCF2SS1-6]RPD71877.1 hypothetical protein L226DRAFT_573548 [Lentinus tigrinus ALCF2SS1-7]
MSLTSFIKAAFAIIYGYDIDTVTAAQPARESWQQRELVPYAGDYAPAPFPSEEDLNGFQPYFSLSGHMPSRAMSIWRNRRFAAV